MRADLIITCDGACRHGIGGYGYMIQERGRYEHLIAGSGVLPDEPTTNQRAELWACIVALEQAASSFPEKPFTVVSDSAYLINCFKEQWFAKWLANGWHSNKGKPVENRDLWERLFAVVGQLNGRREPTNLILHTLTWVHVKGHAGHPANEHCDNLASNAVDDVILERGGRV